jgi:hypothetical protein
MSWRGDRNGKIEDCLHGRSTFLRRCEFPLAYGSHRRGVHARIETAKHADGAHVTAPRNHCLQNDDTSDARGAPEVRIDPMDEDWSFIRAAYARNEVIRALTQIRPRLL